MVTASQGLQIKVIASKSLISHLQRRVRIRKTQGSRGTTQGIRGIVKIQRTQGQVEQNESV